MVSVVVNNSEQQKKIECKKTPNIDTTMQDDIGIGGFLSVQYLIPIFVAWILFVCKCWLEKFVFFFQKPNLMRQFDICLVVSSQFGFRMRL